MHALRFGLLLPPNAQPFLHEVFHRTANLDQIREAQALGILDGVTTNPSLMAKEGISSDEAVKAHYKAICDIVDGDVSAEVISTDFEAWSAKAKPSLPSMKTSW